MAIQELYNKLRLKREDAKEEVVLTLTKHELETILFGLKEAGADVDKGYQHLLSVKGEQKMREERTRRLLKIVKGGHLND